MTTRMKIELMILAILLAFALGRYTRNSLVTTNTRTQTDVQLSQETHKRVVSVTVKLPSGAVKTTTTTTQDTQTDKHTDSKTQETKVVSVPKTLTVSALAGIDTRSMLPTYGVSVSKNLIGPISVGVFGLTNGTLGVSLGLSF